MAKLPREMIQKLEEMKGIDDVWSVDLLRKKVQAHLAARESADRQKATFQQKSDSSSNSANTSRASSSKFKGTTEALVAKESSGQSTRMRCIFCEDSHWNDECPKYKTLEERKNRIKGRCYICLSKSHAVRGCHVGKKCFHCSKAKHHHRSICPTKFGNKRGEAATVAADSTNSAEQNQCTDSTEKSNSESSLLACGENVLLQTAQTGIRAESERGWVRTRLLLDTASHRSYISEKLASQLKLKCTSKEVISVNTFASTKVKDIETKIAKVSLQTGDGSTVEIDVNVEPRITGEISRSPREREREISAIDVLAGYNYYLDFVTEEKIKVQQGLYLLGSKFGWILSGRFTPSNALRGSRSSDALLWVLCYTEQCQRETALFLSVDESYQKPPNLEDFWLLEGIGIKDSPEITDDDKAIENFNRTVKFEDSRYQVTWPWKCENPELPENRELASYRFQGIVKKLARTPEFLQKYDNIIQDQLRKGVMEKVSDDDESTSMRHYISHHPVLTPLKNTTKVRIVYDASAKKRRGEPSLNECILRGPVILSSLCGLLMRFQLQPIVLLSDIEKAFLQVGLQPNDREVTRFFWLKDPKVHRVEHNTQIFRLCRVPFGVIASPFLLGMTVAHHLKNVGGEIENSMIHNMYVENVLGGAKSIEEAKKYYTEAKGIFKQASMNLREWLSNSHEFMEFLPQEDKVKTGNTKVLGIGWNSESDLIWTPGSDTVQNTDMITKRCILKKIAAIIDPLGFFSPVTIRSKIFLHRLWQDKLDWDTPVHPELASEWQKPALELRKISGRQLPRYIGQISSQHNFLICFCDASMQCYATTVYLRMQGDTVQVRLMFAKSRLSPSKKISLPRLELMAALVGVRSLNFIKTELRIPISDMVLYSDSQCVLHWITTKKKLSVFVGNRIKEIKSHPGVRFRYVKTDNNPADLPTRRDKSVSDMSTFWWNGPK